MTRRIEAALSLNVLQINRPVSGMNQ